MSIYKKIMENMEQSISETFNEVVDEKLSCKDDAGEWISDFQKSKDPKFKGKSKEKRKEMALGAYYGKCNESFPGGLVQYDGEMTGETPFTIRGQKFEYCWAIYPDGKRDIGVYAYSGDLCYGYEDFREMMGIK
jgi:hypothetical protein